MPRRKNPSVSNINLAGGAPGKLADGTPRASVSPKSDSARNGPKFSTCLTHVDMAIVKQAQASVGGHISNAKFIVAMSQRQIATSTASVGLDGPAIAELIERSNESTRQQVEELRGRLSEISIVMTQVATKLGGVSSTQQKIQSDLRSILDTPDPSSTVYAELIASCKGIDQTLADLAKFQTPTPKTTASSSAGRATARPVTGAGFVPSPRRGLAKLGD